MEDDLAKRLLPLEGGVNFRDMGGYQAADGRRVKWRRLYRSGTMGRLTAADAAHLAEHGIRVVIDLRTATEQHNEPNRWCEAAGIDYWARPHHETFGNLHEMVDRGFASADDARAVMVAGFRHLPFQQAEAYAELFRRIAAGQVPIAFNCTAGKDRTGGGAALVLAALGVPESTIAADFALTNRAVDFGKAFASASDAQASRYAHLSEDMAEAIRTAHPDYIVALLEEVVRRCGSIEGYLRDIGIDAADLRAVRDELLE